MVRSDVQLMLDVKAGDEVSFELLLHRYRTPLVHFLYRMVRDQASAEDLAQEVFLRVYRAREQYEPSAKFTTWMFRIATNLALNAKRDGRHRQHSCCRGEADGAIDAARREFVPVIVGQLVAVGAEHAAGRCSDSPLRSDRAYRTDIGPGETEAGHGLLLHNRLGGIWEVASDTNRPEPGPTELKQSL